MNKNLPYYNCSDKWQQVMAVLIGIGVCCMRLATGVSNVALGLAAAFGIYLWWHNRKVFVASRDARHYIAYCLAFFSTLLLSAIGSHDMRAILLYWTSNWLGRFVLLFFILVFIHKKCYLLRIVYAYLVVFAVDCGMACYQFFVLHWERGRGFHGDYLDLSAIICMVLAMTAIILLDDRFDKVVKRFALLGFVASIIGLFGCFGRGAFLVSAVVALVYLSFYLRAHKKKAGIIILIVTLLGGALYQSPMYRERLSTTFNVTTNVSNVDRIWTWRSSLDMFKDHPVNGVGLGNWKYYYNHGYKYKEESQNLPHAHSNYMQLLAETGLVGMAGMLLFYWASLLAPFKRWWEERNPWDLIMTCSFLAWALFGIFQPTYLLSSVVRTLWFILSICIQLRNTTDGRG